MGQLHRFVLAAGGIAAIAASVACGGGDGGRGASPTAAAVSTASPAVTSTVAVTATSTAQTPTTAAVAPSATSAAQATSAPAVQPTVAPPPPTPPSAEQSLTIVAKDVKFSPSSLVAKAGGVLHLTLDNQDAGVPHDIVLYDASGAIVGATEPVNGPVQRTVTVMLDSPRYTFKCSVHPQAMNGTLAAQ